MDATRPARTLGQKRGALNPRQQDLPHGRAGYEANVYHFLAQFFNTKLQKYAHNPQATSLLKNLLKDISAKKARFKTLIRLSKNPNASMRFASLSPQVAQDLALSPHVTLKASTLHSKSDLFDFYLAGEALLEPLYSALDQDKSIIVGQKLGRWYALRLKGGELVGLEHSKIAVAKEGWKILKLNLEKLKLVQDPAHLFKQRLQNTLIELVGLLKLDKKQERHILGTQGYKQGRSFYKQMPSIEQIREWIKQSLRIELTKNKSAWNKHGIISHPNFEGFVMPMDSKESIKAFKSKLHWNDKGEIHMVPVKIKE
ncbi:polymorphic toxin type 50 domain-containing protein [Helicobacter labacensis]|uniref:polymorphic toxin type 50 domain-containing protein n=1 Tax=Helicobacter labacensis TaxID=2316079 RepID=UPI0013CE30EC|nr:polymorphic toxin type 50 domain-containing protein [Helicobacter labacensis]